MKKILVLCDGATATLANSAETVILSTGGDSPTVRLEAQAFRNKLQQLSLRQVDLLRIAALVYSADTQCRRGKETDVFAEDWTRDFTFAIPVWDLVFWSKPEVKESLGAALAYVTGDRHEFRFLQRTRKGGSESQQLLQFKEPIFPLPIVDQVVLFSGGADSLAAVLESVKVGKRPMLVSHRSAAQIDSRQKNLVALLQQRYPSWQFPHLSLWVNRQGSRAMEYSQRSRSFLFACAGAITANLLQIDDILLSDNGVVSLNLPQSGQNIGTMLSRSTHPKYLRLVQSFLRLVTDQPGLSISNSLLYKTKREVIQTILDSGHPDLLQETISCAHVEGKTKLRPHCGVCTQCIDRRFAVSAAGAQQHDLVGRYEVDLFTDAIKIGEDRTHVENYLRHAKRLEELQNSDAFFQAFPQLMDCIAVGDDSDAKAKGLFDLMQRHQITVNGVAETLLKSSSAVIRRGEIKEGSILSLLAGGALGEDERPRYIEQLAELLTKSLPAAFKTKSPDNESVVQDVGQTAFIAAKQHLDREGPQLPFATISAKPDFSKKHKPATGGLYIEFKFPKKRPRLNKVVSEMTSRVVIYRDQGAWSLFVVYDPSRSIIDDDAFRKDFERHEGIYVLIVR